MFIKFFKREEKYSCELMMNVASSWSQWNCPFRSQEDHAEKMENWRRMNKGRKCVCVCVCMYFNPQEFRNSSGRYMGELFPSWESLWEKRSLGNKWYDTEAFTPSFCRCGMVKASDDDGTRFVPWLLSRISLLCNVHSAVSFSLYHTQGDGKIPRTQKGMAKCRTQWGNFDAFLLDAMPCLWDVKEAPHSKKKAPPGNDCCSASKEEMHRNW